MAAECLYFVRKYIINLDFICTECNLNKLMYPHIIPRESYEIYLLVKI